jgi:hypothetical protein
MNYLIKRFLRGGIAGGVGAISVIAYNNISNWGDVGMWLNALAISFLVGFVSGTVSTIDKWLRSEEPTEIKEIEGVQYCDRNESVD